MNTEIKAGFIKWLDHVLSGPMPAGIVTFNFNLSEASQKFQVDLIGANHYSAEDSEWACDEAFVSTPRYFDLPHSVVGKYWQDPQHLIAETVTSYIQAAPKSSPLRVADVITIGFVDGDLLKVWPLR